MNVGIVGLGRMGRRHLEACASLGLDVTALSDRNPVTREIVASTLPGVEFVDPDRLVEDDEIDLVIVATTTPSHCEYARLAIAAGRPFVMVEKPLGRSIGECDDLSDTCRMSSSRVAVNHPVRYIQQYQSLVSLVRSEEFGGLSSMHVIGGSGGVAMLGSHVLDLFSMMTREDIVTVEGEFPSVLRPNPRGEEYEDVTGTLRGWTASGKRLHLDLGADQGTGMTAVIAGPFGLAVFDMLSGSCRYRVRERADRQLPTSRYTIGVTGEMGGDVPIDIVAGTAAHINALIGGGDVCGVVSARGYIAVLISAIASSRLGRSIEVGDEHVDRQEVFRWP